MDRRETCGHPNGRDVGGCRPTGDVSRVVIAPVTKARDGGLGQHLRADRGGALVDAQVALVQVVRRPARRAGAEPGHRAGHAVEVPAEVLAAQALGGRDAARLGRAPARRRRPSISVDTLLVDHRRHAAHVVDLGRHAVRRHDLVDQPADQLLGLGPGDGVEHPHRAGDPAGAGDHVVGGAGADHPPDQADAGARVEPAGQDRGQLGDQLAQREGEVLGEVRAGGVPAARRQSRTSSASAAPVSGPSRSPTWPTSRSGRSAARRSGRRRRGRRPHQAAGRRRA